MSRNSSNVGTSILAFKTGDMTKAAVPSCISILTGGLQTPNGPDNTIYYAQWELWKQWKRSSW
jgi:hypothetical protein